MYDGQTIYYVDVISVVNKCFEVTKDYSQITVDVVMTAERDITPVDASDYVTYQVALRAGKILASYSAQGSYLRAVHAFPDVNFRHVIAPSQKLDDNFNQLTLTRDQIDAMVTLGEADAAAAVAGGDSLTEDMTQYFGARVRRDRRLKTQSFPEFLRLREEGAFGKDYQSSAQTPALFLH
jgi:hypothetical protein